MDQELSSLQTKKLLIKSSSKCLTKMSIFVKDVKNVCFLIINVRSPVAYSTVPMPNFNNPRELSRNVKKFIKKGVSPNFREFVWCGPRAFWGCAPRPPATGVLNEDVNEDIKEDINEDMNEDKSKEENEDVCEKIAKFINEGLSEDFNEDMHADLNEDKNDDANEDVNEDVKEDKNEDKLKIKWS